jgi:hypothetical protein
MEQIRVEWASSGASVGSFKFLSSFLITEYSSSIYSPYHTSATIDALNFTVSRFRNCGAMVRECSGRRRTENGGQIETTLEQRTTMRATEKIIS